MANAGTPRKYLPVCVCVPYNLYERLGDLKCARRAEKCISIVD